jgi:hypothetical protein
MQLLLRNGRLPGACSSSNGLSTMPFSETPKLQASMALDHTLDPLTIVTSQIIELPTCLPPTQVKF